MNAIAANKEHNITVVSLQVDQAPPDNIHYILLENVYETIYNVSAVTDWVAVGLKPISVFKEVDQCTEYCVLNCNGELMRNYCFF